MLKRFIIFLIVVNAYCGDSITVLWDTLYTDIIEPTNENVAAFPVDYRGTVVLNYTNKYRQTRSVFDSKLYRIHYNYDGTVTSTIIQEGLDGYQILNGHYGHNKRKYLSGYQRSDSTPVIILLTTLFEVGAVYTFPQYKGYTIADCEISTASYLNTHFKGPDKDVVVLTSPDTVHSVQFTSTDSISVGAIGFNSETRRLLVAGNKVTDSLTALDGTKFPNSSIHLTSITMLGDIAWEAEINGNYSDSVHYVSARDSGWVITGRYNYNLVEKDPENNSHTSNLGVATFDHKGNEVWNKTFSSGMGNFVKVLSTGHIIATSQSGTTPRLLALSSLGDKIKEVEGMERDTITDVVVTNENELLIHYTKDWEKYSSTLNQIAKLTNTDSEKGTTKIVKTVVVDSTLFTVGNTSDVGYGHSDIFMTTTTANGSLTSLHHYGTEEDESIRAVIAMDSTVLLAGKRSNQLLLMKLNRHGDTVWTKTHTLDFDSFKVSYGANGLVLLTSKLTHNGSKSTFIKLTSSGDIVYIKEYENVPNHQPDHFGSFKDGFFILERNFSEWGQKPIRFLDIHGHVKNTKVLEVFPLGYITNVHITQEYIYTCGKDLTSTSSIIGAINISGDTKELYSKTSFSSDTTSWILDITPQKDGSLLFLKKTKTLSVKSETFDKEIFIYDIGKIDVDGVLQFVENIYLGFTDLKLTQLHQISENKYIATGKSFYQLAFEPVNKIHTVSSNNDLLKKQVNQTIQGNNLKIRFSQKPQQKGQVTLYRVNGQRMISTPLSLKKSVSITLPTLASGVYFSEVTLDNAVHVMKFRVK